MSKKMLKFTKMQALENDFMVVDAIHQDVSFSRKLIQQWADRHRGVGFDQLLVVERSRTKDTDFFYRIFNADGSEVGQCGNGARCFARFVYEKGLTHKTHIKVATRSGLIELHLKKNHHVSVNMGIPRVNIRPLKIKNITLKVGVVSIGNPHCVIQVPNINEAPVKILGTELNKHSQFPKGINVGFMEIVNSRQIRLRVYERGVGETQACGSGACAATVVGNQLGLLKSKVKVQLPGGDLIVTWQGPNSSVFLEGSAATSFEGEIEKSLCRP